MSDPLLHHHTIAADGAERWMYVLHGIYGAGRNWATFAHALTAARPEWGVELVDLRLHGHSTGFEPPHTLAACATDLRRLAAALDRSPSAVLGHSFGGKVALLTAPGGAASQIWVVDSTPSRRTPGGSAYRMLQILRTLPGPFEERSDAVDALERDGFARHVAQWMATNLEPRHGSYRWRLDLEGLGQLLDDFFRQDLWEILESPPEGTEIHMVRATESDVLQEADRERLEARANDRVRVHAVRGGHWLHVDNPDALERLLVEHLPGS